MTLLQKYPNSALLFIMLIYILASTIIYKSPWGELHQFANVVIWLVIALISSKIINYDSKYLLSAIYSVRLIMRAKISDTTW